MKAKAQILVFSILGVASILSAAASAGPSTGGGGDVVVFQGDDRVVLADPFSVGAGSDELEPSSELRAELERAIRILSYYYGSEALFRDITLSPNIQYSYVDRLPSFKECDERLSYAQLPEGARVEQIACTVGNQTWLRKDLVGRLGVRDLTLLLVHEGLRRVETGVSGLAIAQITTGLGVALDHLNRQIQGEREPLNRRELTQMRAMVVALVENGLWTPEPRQRSQRFPDFVRNFGIHRNGGALIPEESSNISESAFIGIGRVKPGSRIGEGAVLVNTNACASKRCELGSGARIVHTNVLQLANLEIGSEAVIENSRLDSLELRLGRGSRIMNSAVSGSITMKDESSISASSLELWSYRPLEVGSRSKIIGSTITARSGLVLEDGVELSRFRDAVLGEKAQGFVGGIVSGFRGNKMVFRKGFSLDLEGRALCQFGKNHFVPYDGRWYAVSSVNDLVLACKEQASAGPGRK